MSSIFQNARLIHIVGEVVILSAVVIYFHLQNQKLTSHIKEIVKKLEEQDELLKKHDVILQRLLTANVQSFQNPGRQQVPQFQEQPMRPQAPQFQERPQAPQTPQPTRQQPKTEIKIKKVETKPVALNLDTSIKEVEVEVEEDETENEEDLDQEIAKELEELEENDEIVVE